MLLVGGDVDLVEVEAGHEVAVVVRQQLDLIGLAKHQQTRGAINKTSRESGESFTRDPWQLNFLRAFCNNPASQVNNMYVCMYVCVYKRIL